jgi:hypothetical protein
MGGKGIGLGVLFLAGVSAGWASDGTQVDDDLAVVRKAVHSSAPSAAPAPRAPSREARWLKVRIVEGRGRSRINVKLPLAAVKAVGGDLPVNVKGVRLRLTDILRTLESGEPLVEVNDEDSDVRVWVE